VLSLYFTVVVALPLALGIYVMLNGLHRTRSCPSCADETLRLQVPAHRLINRLLRESEIQTRWCLRCGWRGMVRLRRAPLPARRAGRVLSALAGTPGPDHVDIRRLDIDGLPWKVFVQCWSEDGRWVGRLLFVAPDGRTCMEEQSSLEGDSALDVLSTALSIPEQTLAGRLRRAIH
jgi:hypothetical protein